MKHLFSFLLLFYMTAVNAQTILKGDMNNDEQVSIADVTSLVNVILGKAPQEEISVGGDPYKVDNSLVVGTWVAPDNSSFALNEDGTTTFSDAATFKFRPVQGVLTFYDASENPVRAIVLNDVTSDYLMAIDYATNTFTKYTKQISLAELTISGETTFVESTVVTITPSDVDHDVYYTLDGTDPKTSSTQVRYMEPFTITETCTVRAWEEDADIYAEKTFTKAEAPAEMTVEDVIAAAPENTNATEGQQKVWVKGYIVGFVDGAKLAEGAKFTAEGCETATNLLLATNPAETNVENCIPVQLPAGDIRAALNLQDNPDNLGKEVKLYGYVLKYFSVPGLKNVTNYTFIDTREQHSYVDLGLPSGTLWATCNIGANSPEEYGDYFAWGETKGYNDGKTNFDWINYKWCEGSSITLTKYNTENNKGTVDDKTKLDEEDDAAYVNWGKDWRIPTNNQFNELINVNYTTTKWTTQNGVNGYIITSNSNNNSIFLPAAGYYEGSLLSLTESKGYYWSCELFMLTKPGTDYACRLNMDSRSIGLDYGSRNCGRSVRPVRASE